MKISNLAGYLFVSTGMVVSCMAQQWDVGAIGGGSLYLNNSVKSQSGSGTIGHKPSFAAGGWLGHTAVGKFGGEIRYVFEKNTMKLSSGSNSYTFLGKSHALMYDLLYHTTSREDQVRPFIAVGGGMKSYRGSGAERAVQPLQNLAILSRTKQWQPMASVGGGVKWRIGSRMMMRVEVRDYITPYPTIVILPAFSSQIKGWVHNITPTIGISYIFQ